MQQRIGAFLTAIAPATLGLIAVNVGAQSPEPDIPLFANDAPLEIRLEGPFRTLSRNRRDREEVDGGLLYMDAAGNEVRLDVQIRTRGNSRMGLCTHPPLRLNFRRRQVEGTLFAGQDRIKLVTLCKNSAAYRDYLTLEYEIYRLFNALTDVSYRVRWAEIEYIQTDGRRRPRDVMPGFFIEEDFAVAERTGLETWRVGRLQLDQLDPHSTALLGLFHFLIGNTDWAATTGPPNESCCHNGDVLRNADGRAVILPYDFDQSGLIDADYAKPADSLPIRSVRQRLYRGYCQFNSELDNELAKIISSRAELAARLTNADVGDSARNRALRFFDSFFELVENPDARARAIDDACRG